MTPARAERFEGPPPWRIGGRVGFTLDTCSLPDSAGWVLVVSLRLPPATIALLSRDERGGASLRAEVRTRSRSRGIVEAAQDFVLAPEDSAVGQGKVLLLRFPAASGPYEVRARLSDMLSRPLGLIHTGTQDHEFVEITGTVDVPVALPAGALGDPEFLWPDTARAAPGAFVRGGRVVMPNPERLYGLLASDLRARVAARGRADAENAPWHWDARILDAGGVQVARGESTLAAGRWLDADVAFDVSTLPAGGYVFGVRAWQEGARDTLVRRARFSIGWRLDTWTRSAADIADEVHFLLSTDDEHQFVTALPGEQERVLDEFWVRRDPTPATAENEALRKFHARVAHANTEWGRTGAVKGMFTDMGRTYIRWGEPAEVLHQVMPAGNETLTEQLQQIIDTESRTPEDVAQHGLGGDQRPYEVWIYEGDLAMPLDADPTDPMRGRSKRRMLFLFVDEHGLGSYRLRYSTE